MPISAASNLTSQFTSKERDAETGLDFFLARYYSGAQGRFLSVDPENAGARHEDPQSWNAYAYSRNNPLKYTDPDGKRYSLCNESNSCFEMSDQGFISTYWLRPGIKKGKGSNIGMGTLFWNDEWWNYEQMYVDPEEEPIHDASFGLATLFIGGGKAGGLLRTGGREIAEKVAEKAAGATLRNEVKGLIVQASQTIGNKGAVASSKESALAAAEQWVGIGAKHIRDGGKIVGKVSADGQRVYRITSIDKAQPYVNLVNRTTGGNLHVRF